MTKQNFTSNPGENSTSNSQKKSEHLTSVSLLLIGFIGMFLTINSFDTNKNQSYSNNATILSSKIYPTQKVSSSPLKLLKKGTKEVGQPITLVLPNFKRLAHYSIDLGNGRYIPFEQGKIVHIFSKSGNHHIRIKEKIKGISHTILNETISIDPAILQAGLLVDTTY